MKNSRRKLTIAIIGLAAVLVITSVLLFLFWPKPLLELKQLPPEWKKVQEFKAHDDAFGVVYSGTGTEEDALASFKTIMQKSGWTYVRDVVKENFTSIQFKRGQQEAAVFAEGTTPSITIFVLVYTPQVRDDVKTPELPEQDYPGFDIPDVLRYPGSIRTSYENSPNGASIVYSTLADTKILADFYATQLLADGWILQAMAVEGEKAEIFAAKEGERVTVTIETEKDIAGYANVRILLIQR